MFEFKYNTHIIRTRNSNENISLTTLSGACVRDGPAHVLFPALFTFGSPILAAPASVLVVACVDDIN